ncbi:MAG: hypothetical protein ACTSYE_11580 [Alphaproteobacteria bacterium]
MRAVTYLSVLATCFAFLTNGAAQADSRLFSIQTDIPGLTVTAASQDDRPLAVAGTSGGVTFFRVDNPAGAVPCFATLSLRISDGSTLVSDIDFCAQNWDVTVSLTSSPAPGPGSGALTITTDDPAAHIMAVFIAGQPVPITSATGPAVAVAADALGSLGGCLRDIALDLADGRRMARLVDICASGEVVVVPLIGQPSATQPQSAQPQLPAVPALQPAGPEAAMSWTNDRNGGQARLTYGIPQTDAGELAAVCELGTGDVTMVLSRSAPETFPGQPVGVRFRAGNFDAAYTATGTEISQLSGRSHPRLVLNTGDPLWPALIRENVLSIQIGSLAPFALSLKGSAVNARAFLANCNPAPPAPPPPTGNVGPVAFLCHDGSMLSAAFAADSVTVFEGGAAPLLLQRIGSSQGARFVAAGAELIGLDEQITWRRPGFAQRTCRPQ